MDTKKIAQGLARAVMTPTDELAAKKGEGNLLVQIKRNSDRLEGCELHDFEPTPDWRNARMLTYLKVPCRRCGGEMNAHDVMVYLRGVAHGSGQSFKALTDAVFPT